MKISRTTKFAIAIAIALGFAATEVLANKLPRSDRPTDAVNTNSPSAAGGAPANVTEERGQMRTVDSTDVRAQDQMKGTQQDVQLTRKIRERLVREASLSTSAQNVTVVTIDNVVTLRGSVRSKAESDKVAEIARSEAGGTVKNELQIR